MKLCPPVTNSTATLLNREGYESGACGSEVIDIEDIV